jgi:hypothetical protein
VRAGWLVRFALEGAFIVAVLVAARLAGLDVVWTILAGFVAWLLTAVAESFLARGWRGAVTFVPPVHSPQREPPTAPPPQLDWPMAPPEDIAPEWIESAEVLGVRVSGFEPAPPLEDALTLVESWPVAVPVARPRPRGRRLPRRLAAPRRPRVPRPPEPAVAVDPPAEVSAPPTEGPGRACVSCGQPISNERLLAFPDAAQCLDCTRAGRPAVPHPPPPEHSLPPGGREWNVRELERLASRVGGQDAARDEERGFLLVYLREFASPEGLLPSDFDALVRESFPELVSASGSA